jgi:hypothetical protein
MVIALVVVAVVVMVLVIPSWGSIPIGMLLAPAIVALFRMAVAVAEIGMIRRMVVTVLGALRIAETRSQKEQGGESEHSSQRFKQFDHGLYLGRL